MHTIQSAIPDARLRPFIRCFAQREISAQSSSVVESTMASLEHIASFHLSGRQTIDHCSGMSTVVPDIHFFGTQTRSLGKFSFTESVLQFGIFLKPFASWELFRIPPAEFTDQNFKGREVFGPWITVLWQRLGECQTFRHRVQLATETLLPFAEHATSQTAAMAAARNLFEVQSGVRIEQLARASYMTIRSFQRKFVRDIGLSPKLFGRLRRFQMALDRKRTSGTKWLDVAHDLGYFDQMHMVKEFWAFGGEAPSGLLQSCGDYQPWSIGESLSLNTVTNHLKSE